MNDNHESLHDESDETLDRAIRAAKAQSSPADVKNRVIETAAAWQRQLQIAVGDQRPAAHDALVEEAKEGGSGAEALAGSFGPVERLAIEEHERQSRVGVSNNHFLEKVKSMILTHKRLSAAAAAALAALAASLVLYVSLFSSTATAYALEQSVRASDRVTSYHVKITPAAEIGEMWVQLNPDGTPLRARMNSQTKFGAKVEILSEGKAEVWDKDRKQHIVIPQKDGLKYVMKMRSIFDPKFAFEQLQADEKAGKAQVELKEPAKKGEPITLTVTFKDKPNRRMVYEINPKTKLAERVIGYERQGEQWKQTEFREYLDYNKEIDLKVFQLDLPKDAETIDQIKRKPGLVKGDLTNEEIATKVAREFFEALIAEDYDKAGLMYSGLTAERAKELFGKTKILRIVETKKPTPRAANHSLEVPVKVEWEVKGLKKVHSDSPTVRTTDAERATKAVREFYEAAIAQDDVRAFRIFEEAGIAEIGLKAEDVKNLKEVLAQRYVKFVRIVEIGKPESPPESGTTEVPVKIELEVNMPKQVREFSPNVRPCAGQPDRWEICGGI